MTHKPDIIRQLEILLKDIYENHPEMMGSGVVDQEHQLCIMMFKKDIRFEICDNEAFDQLQTIMETSPKHPIETIWFKFPEGFCTIHPLSIKSYLIVVFERDLKLGLPIPYDRYKHDIRTLLSQLGEAS